MHCQQPHRLDPTPTCWFCPLKPFKPRNISKAAAVPASAASAGPVLVKDGAVIPAPTTAQQLLSEHRGWSYTTALVQQQYDVVDWELHIERLIRNMQVLAQQRPPAYAGFMKWQQQHHKGDQAAVATALQQLVNPMVATALQQLTHGSGQEASDTAASQQQAMLVVTLGDKPPAAHLEPHSVDTIAAAPAGHPPLSVLVWAKPVAPAANTAAKVLVAGDPRPAAQAKHCDWVVERRPLEQLKQHAGVDEVLLSDSSGCLLEGLASNFYVLADAAQLAACGSSPGTVAAEICSQSPELSAGQQGSHQQQQPQEGQQVSPSETQCQQQQQQQQQHQHQHQHQQKEVAGLVLLSAGPSSGDAVLLGVTQQRVLQACRRLQLPVVHKPPMGDSRAAEAWREAFLTNCLKGLQPVQQVTLADGGMWQLAGQGTATSLLRQEVEKLQISINMQQWLR